MKTSFLITLLVLFNYLNSYAQRTVVIGSDEQDSIPKVVTEDLLHVGGGSVQMAGRITSIGKIPIEDHGFLLAILTDEKNFQCDF